MRRPKRVRRDERELVCRRRHRWHVHGRRRRRCAKAARCTTSRCPRPKRPRSGVRRGAGGLRDEVGVQQSDLRLLLHGTTLATNAIIERRLASTALVTTQGFRDVLEIGRHWRDELYDPFLEYPGPLVSRELRFEVDERIDAAGDVVAAVDRPSAQPGRRAARSSERRGCRRRLPPLLPEPRSRGGGHGAPAGEERLVRVRLGRALPRVAGVRAHVHHRHERRVDAVDRHVSDAARDGARRLEPVRYASTSGISAALRTVVAGALVLSELARELRRGAHVPAVRARAAGRRSASRGRGSRYE